MNRSMQSNGKVIALGLIVLIALALSARTSARTDELPVSVRVESVGETLRVRAVNTGSEPLDVRVWVGDSSTIYVKAITLPPQDDVRWTFDPETPLTGPIIAGVILEDGAPF